MLIGIHITAAEARSHRDRVRSLEPWQKYRDALDRVLSSTESHAFTPILRGVESRSLAPSQATQIGHFASSLSARYALEPADHVAAVLVRFLQWITQQDVLVWGGGFVQGQFLKGAVLALDAAGELLDRLQCGQVIESLILGCIENPDPRAPVNNVPNGAQPMRRFLEIPGVGFHLKDEQVNNWDILSAMGVLYVCSAADALLPERAADVTRWLDVARPRVERFFRLLYTDEGEYGEGPGYYSYGTTGAVMTLDLLKRWGRCDWADVLPTTGLYNSPRWARAMHPREVEHGPFNVNDSYLGMAESPLVAHWIAARSRDAESQAFGDELMRLAVRRLDDQPAAERDLEPIVWSLVWRDPNLAPTTSKSKSIRSFGRFGTVIARSGCTSDDTCLLFRCGEPAGAHSHADRGNFLLTAFGENLVSEGGRPLDRAAVPEFMKFHHETWAHNCAMPAGRPQARAHDGRYVWGRITRYEPSDNGVSLAADLSDVYPGAGRVERKLTFSFDGWLLIEDFIEHPDESIDFLLHTDNRDRKALVSIERDRAVIRRPAATLLIFPLLADTKIVDDGTHFQDADREGLRSLVLKRAASSMATLLVAVRAGLEDSVHPERTARWRLFIGPRAHEIST